MDKVILVFTGLFALAVVAVIVSQKAQTAKVIQALGTGVGGVINSAVSPVTGQAGATGP